jgi:hypothetical protein
VSESSPQGQGGFAGFELNHPDVRPLAQAVGSLIANFGAVELSALAWLHALSQDKVLVDALDQLKLRERTRIILHLIANGRVPQEFVERCTSLWKEASKLAELRNQVAHNPIMYGWRGAERPGKPDYAGIIDRRRSAKSRPAPALIELPELNTAIDRIAELVRELHTITAEIDAVQSASKA